MKAHTYLIVSISIDTTALAWEVLSFTGKWVEPQDVMLSE